jgi:hypothetical protein
MDTDDLTKEVYEILLLAAGINDFLKAELGYLSRKYANEDEYLQGMLDFILAIKADPEDYRDSWLHGVPLARLQ